jgi:hypothetical protein
LGSGILAAVVRSCPRPTIFPSRAPCRSSHRKPRAHHTLTPFSDRILSDYSTHYPRTLTLPRPSSQTIIHRKNSFPSSNILFRPMPSILHRVGAQRMYSDAAVPRYSRPGSLDEPFLISRRKTPKPGFGGKGTEETGDARNRRPGRIYVEIMRTHSCFPCSCVVILSSTATVSDGGVLGWPHVHGVNNRSAVCRK